MKLLVTGGAGYVGSVCAAHLVEAGHEVVVLDDLSTGHRDAVPTEARFIEADLAQAADEVLAEGFDGVLHFAAKSLVGESVQRPELYWRGNVVTAVELLDAMSATARRGWCSPRRRRPTASPRRCRSARTRRPGRRTPTGRASSRSTTRSARTRAPTDSPRPACATSTWPARTAVSASGTRWRPISFRSCCRSAPGSASAPRSSATTGPPRTAPASATTSTSTTSRRRTCWPSARGRPANTRSTTSAAAPASRCARSWRRAGGHRAPHPRRRSSRGARGDPAVLVASSAAATAALGWHPEKTDLLTIVGDAWRFAQERQPV